MKRLLRAIWNTFLRWLMPSVGTDTAEVAATPATEPAPKAIPQNRRAIAPAAGYAWNPLQKFPVNKPCFCGSKKKFKACHKETMPKVVKTDAVAGLEEVMAKYLEVQE